LKPSDSPRSASTSWTQSRRVPRSLAGWGRVESTEDRQVGVERDASLDA
jgi:hypothetical protein